MAAKGTLVEVGPWGGESGVNLWRFKAEVGSRITQITIKSDGDVVTSIMFTYRDEEDVKHQAGPFGGGGGVPKIITFNDTEELTRISGTLGGDTIQIKTLSFQTNQMNTYDAGGKPGNTTFTLPVNKGKVSGFFGTSSNALDSLGLILRP